MFRLFKRRHDEPKDSSPESPEEQRLYAHSRIPDAADLTTYLRLEDEGEPILVELIDMSIQGAGIKVPFHLAPVDGHAHYVELVVSHALDGWKVSSLATVSRVQKIDDAFVHVGLQFANLGDLYAQLDDALGRYFNRRASTRVKPALEESLPVKISYEHHRLRGRAQDLSRTGIGVRMTLVDASVLESGEIVKVRFEVPGMKEALEVPARVRHGYRVAEDVVLGLEYDLDKDSALKQNFRRYQDYLAEREKAILDFQLKLTRPA